MNDSDPQPIADEEELFVKRWLTIPGRLLLILTIIGASGFFYWAFLASLTELPARRYPLLLRLIPAWLVGAAFFAATAWLLERAGVPIYRRKS